MVKATRTKCNCKENYTIMSNNDISNGLGHIICPNCFSAHKINYTNTTACTLVDMEVNPDVPIRAYNELVFMMKCPICNKEVKGFFCDNDMTEHIVALNKKGYTTEFCCAGHSPKDRRYIIFDKNYDFSSNSIKYWHIINDRDGYEYMRSEIEYNYNKNNIIPRNVLFAELKRWIDELPDISMKRK